MNFYYEKNFEDHLLLILILPEFLLSQTVLIDSLQEGGFNLGPTFCRQWLVISQWHSNKCLVCWRYAFWIYRKLCLHIEQWRGKLELQIIPVQNGSFYRNVVLPQGINYMELSFSWINIGEVAPNDVLMVSIAPTTYTPSQTNTTAVILSKTG